jgi:hypothetical protein
MNPHASACGLAFHLSRVPWRAIVVSAATIQKGSSVAEVSASAEMEAMGKHLLPSFWQGSGEAPCDVVRVRVVM